MPFCKRGGLMLKSRSDAGRREKISSLRRGSVIEFRAFRSMALQSETEAEHDRDGSRVGLGGEWSRKGLFVDGAGHIDQSV